MILVRSWPARPTNGSPWRSSSAPGASPKKTTRGLRIADAEDGLLAGAGQLAAERAGADLGVAASSSSVWQPAGVAGQVGGIGLARRATSMASGGGGRGRAERRLGRGMWAVACSGRRRGSGWAGGAGHARRCGRCDRGAAVGGGTLADVAARRPAAGFPAAGASDAAGVLQIGWSMIVTSVRIAIDAGRRRRMTEPGFADEPSTCRASA